MIENLVSRVRAVQWTGSNAAEVLSLYNEHSLTVGFTHDLVSQSNADECHVRVVDDPKELVHVTHLNNWVVFVGGQMYSADITTELKELCFGPAV